MGLGQVGLSPAAGFELSVKGLGARKAGVEALEMRELRVKLDLTKLLKRRVRITRITLVAPVVFLVRHKDGSFNFSGGRAALGKTTAVNRVVVHQGRLVYTDKGTGRRVEAEGLELNLNNLVYGGRPGDGPLKKIFFAGDIRCAALKTDGLSVTGLSLWINSGKGLFKADHLAFEAAGVAGGGSLLADINSGTPAYKLSYVSGRRAFRRRNRGGAG